MKKLWKATVFALIAVMLFALCGCQSGKRDYLVFYVWGDNTELSWYEKVASDFKAESGFEVRVERSMGTYYDNLNIALNSKTKAPDIFFTQEGEIMTQLRAGRILNLSPYIESGALDVKTESNADGKIELWDVNDAYLYDGQALGSGDYYAFIKDWSPDFMLWYNKSHIDEYNRENNLKEGDKDFMEYPSATVPMTWSEFTDMSYKLTKKEGGLTTRYGTMLDRVPYSHLMEFIQMTGESVFDADGKYMNTSENVIKAYSFMSELQKGEKASAPVIGPSGIGSGESFANGNVSFVWFGSWAYSSYNWDSVSFEIGIAPPPLPDRDEPYTEEDRYGVSSGMIALAINKNSQNVDKAVEFLNYYMTKGQEFFASKGYNIPGNKLVAESDDYLYPENNALGEINRTFYEFALNYTHSIGYNKYVPQSIVEDIISKHMSTYYNNYNPDNLASVVQAIANDLKNEVE